MKKTTLEPTEFVYSKHYTFKLILGQAIDRETKKANEFKDKLAADFAYYFTWGYAHDIYKMEIIISHLKEIMRWVDEEDITVSELLGRIEGRQLGMTREVLDGRFTGSSTAVSHNTAHTLKMETYCEIIKVYQSYVSQIKIDKFPIK